MIKKMSLSTTHVVLKYWYDVSQITLKKGMFF